MASFCAQCSADMGFEAGDLKGITKQEDWDRGMACMVLCEDCGGIQVNPDGECVSEDCLKPGHAKPWKVVT